MTTTTEITDSRIAALESEAFAAGDALMGYMCRVARGSRFTAAELNDASCLDAAERRQIEALTRGEAAEYVREALQA